MRNVVYREVGRSGVRRRRRSRKAVTRTGMFDGLLAKLGLASAALKMARPRR